MNWFNIYIYTFILLQIKINGLKISGLKRLVLNISRSDSFFWPKDKKANKQSKESSGPSDSKEGNSD